MQSPQTESFAAFVTRKRKEHNMTMRFLANILGVSSTYLYDVEPGTETFSRKRISKSWWLSLSWMMKKPRSCSIWLASTVALSR